MKKYFEKLYKGNLEAFSCDLKEKLDKKEKAFIITANPETLMIAEKNPEFQKILLDEETMITADGIGVVRGAEKLGYDIHERIAGVDIVKKLFEIANDSGKSLYLFGARPEVVKKLAELLCEQYPKINLLGYSDGYVQNRDKVFENIVKIKPDIVLVALGIPAQELLISKYYKEFDNGIFIGIGGAFDVLSGMKKRAPRFFVKHNLEWLYRICSEPKRMKRFYQSNVNYLKIIRKMKSKSTDCF